MESKICKQCSSKFEISSKDLEFYSKISPTICGQTFDIPSPSLCHECRQIRRLIWRNERNLYKRNCAATGEQIVTVYNPDSRATVYKNEYWRSDAWDPMDYGQDYDPASSFFNQLEELFFKVPKQANNSTIAENCNYCNFVWHTKNCYLCFNAGYSEDCLFSSEIIKCKDCMDCFSTRECERCFSCFDCINCSDSKFIEKCDECNESYFSFDCKGCNNVFLSNNLRNKQFVFKNEQLTREKYFELLEKIDMGDREVVEQLKEDFKVLKESAVHSSNSNKLAENSTGDYLRECKNCEKCFDLYKSQDSKFITNANSDVRDSMDVDNCAELELGYEGLGITGYKTIFGFFIIYSKDSCYNIFCESCTNIFGCVGLTHKSYCILNKQYTKEEYGKKVCQIIENMIEYGEWGEYFPVSMSPFAYNETNANIFHPKTKEDAIKINASWLEKNFGLKLESEPYQPKANIKSYKDDSKEREALISGILECKRSKKPYKIIPQELAFYIKHTIPVPEILPEERYLELFSHRNPRKLYHRKCMNEGCENEFETTYAPDRPEKVYCEKCYEKAVI